MEKSVERLFLGFSIAKLNELTTRIMDCIGRLQEDQIWPAVARTRTQSAT